jgi:hypothetical protein
MALRIMVHLSVYDERAGGTAESWKRLTCVSGHIYTCTSIRKGLCKKSKMDQPTIGHSFVGLPCPDCDYDALSASVQAVQPELCKKLMLARVQHCNNTHSHQEQLSAWGALTIEVAATTP